MLDEDYIRWLTLNHPDALPQRTNFVSSPQDLQDGCSRANCDESIHSNSSPETRNRHRPESSSSTPVHRAPLHSTPNTSPTQEAETPDNSGTLQSSESTSKSLENTRKVFSAISQFLEFPGGTVSSKKKSKNNSGAKVLTSEQSLALLEEKARKKREEEEAKERRKQEREEKKAKREEEKKQKAEERAQKAAKKAEEQANKIEERKRIAAEKKRERECKNQSKPSGKRVSTRSSDGTGLQSAEVSNNECAICLGAYEDDIGEDGELLFSWVECTNQECKKWMHEQCLEKCDGDLFVCGVCSSCLFELRCVYLSSSIWFVHTVCDVTSQP